MLVIRPAVHTDIPAITGIYNEAIIKTNASFDVEPKSEAEQLEWFEAHGAKNPVLVAELDGQVTGWASLSSWSDRCAYANTAEISIYVLEQFQEKGIGRKLIEAITAEGEKAGLHTIISRIVSGNDSSIHLHEQVGFRHIGTMKEVGYKFGELLDVYLMQKIYDNR